MSVATLGFAVNSGPLVSAKAALDGLTAAAKPAQNAANLLKSSFAAVQAALSQLISIQQASLAQQSTMTAAFDRLSQSLSKVNQVAPTVVATTAAVSREAKSTAVTVTATGKALDTMTGAAKPAAVTVAATGKALVDMTAAAKPAAQAVAEIGKATTGAVTSVTHLETAAQKTADGGTKALTTQTGLARHELINLSRQIQDIFVSLLGGQSPFTVMAQQGTQVADIYGSSRTGTVGGSLKQIGGIIASILTPMRLLTLGVVGLGAGFLALAKNAADSSKALDDVSRASGTTLAQMHGLQQAASFKGIDTSDFFDAMKKFGASVYDAQHGMGGLADVFRANNAHAKDFTGYLSKAADLIKNARSDQQRLQLLQEMGLPATMEWVRLLESGSQGIKAAIAASVTFNESAERNLIAKARAFDEAWNKATTQMSQYIKSSVIDAMGWIDQLSKHTLTIAAGLGAALTIALAPFSLLAATLAGIATAIAAAAAYVKGSSPDAESSGRPRVVIDGGTTDKGDGSTRDPATDRQAIQREQQRIALLGQTATAADAVRMVELQVAQARADGVSITQKQVNVLKELAREQTLGITQIKAMTDSYGIEAATIGMSAGAATQYAAAQNAINQAHRAGRALTQDNIAAINAQAQALGDAAAKADLMQAAYSGLVRGPLQTLTSQIANGAKFFDALKSAGISALNAIASKLADMAAQNLWQAAMGGATGGGGLLGMLFGGGASATSGLGGLAAIHHTGGIVGSESTNMRAVDTSLFHGAPRFHSGLMPDEFPAILQKGEGVFTRGQMAAMGGAANSNTPQDVNININVSGARGSQEISDAVNQGVSRGLAAYRGSIAQVNDVAAASKRAGTRRLGR